MTGRALKVGEMIKRALTSIIQEEILEPSLEGTSVIISEVKVTPDLKSAFAYILPMTGSPIHSEKFLALMNNNIPRVRKLLCKKVALRVAPQLVFRLDDTFEAAAKLNKLINK